MNDSRRKFILKAVIASGITNTLQELQAKEYSHHYNANALADDAALKINVFSKHLHWVKPQDLGNVAAEIGFDGVDITVRPDGHVVPERVEEDLPRIVAAIKQAGLKVYMITTSITNADDPLTESILRVAGSLGIKYYRMGWIKYDPEIKIEENLKRIQQQLIKLVSLNKRYNIRGDYQNHSGANFGSPVWDLWSIIKEFDPADIGAQYDILHATVEGANSWPLGLQLLKHHIKSADLKDFNWIKKDEKWVAQTVPLGEGMVDYKKYFDLLKSYHIRPCFSMHFEYPLGGAETGAKTLSVNKEVVTTAMKNDLNTLRNMINSSGLTNK